jgi:hypothetical protein
MGALGDRALYRSIRDFIEFREFTCPEWCEVLGSCGRSSASRPRHPIDAAQPLAPSTAAARRIVLCRPLPGPRSGRHPTQRGSLPESARGVGRSGGPRGELSGDDRTAIGGARKSRGCSRAGSNFFSVHKVAASDRLVTGLIKFRSSTPCPQPRAGCPQTMRSRQQARRLVPRVFHR